MTDLRVYAKQTDVGRQRDDTWVNLRASRDGSPIVLPWYQALVLEGRAYQIGNDPGTELTVMTTYADTSKTLYVDIPDGTAAIPLKVQYSFAASGAARLSAIAVQGGAVIPLPASAWMGLSLLGALFVLGRRKKRLARVT